MKTMSKLIMCVMIMMCMLACPSNSKEQMSVKTINTIVQDYARETTDPEDVQYMKALLIKEIDRWVEEYSGMGFYKEEAYKVSDIMLFGKDKDKVLLIVHALLADSKDAESKLLVAQLTNDDEWEFRFTGMPSFYYEYNEKLRNGIEFTDEEILARTFDNLIDDGLINFYDHISQDYIKNKWF